MADQSRWWKLWHSALDDDALASLPLDDFARWCKLGAYTKAHGTNGRVKISPSNPVILAMFCVTEDRLESTLKRLPNITVSRNGVDGVTMLVEWHNWLQYQDDTTNAERQKRWRARNGDKKRREERRVSASPSDVEHPRREATSEPPGNWRSSATPIDPKLIGWLQGTKHLGSLANPNRGDLWAALEKAYDQYEWLYFQEEISKADAWIEANLARKPTERGMPRFIRSWLERAVEYGRRHGKG